MLILGFLFAFATMLAAFVSIAIRGTSTVGELWAWVLVAGAFVLAGALAGKGERY
jgi:hypothetical protein